MKNVKRAKCVSCGADVFLAIGEYGQLEFETHESRMLVVVSTPEVDGKKRIALGPLRKDGEPYVEGEEPIQYYGHLMHLCKP